jgi:hypothetical protein
MADTATPDTTQPTTTATIPENVPTPASAAMGGSPPPPPSPTPATTDATIPDQPTAQPGQAPGVLIEAKRGGLAGVLDEVRNWIAGTNSSQVYIDPQTGDRYMQHPAMSAKQQWLKVGGEALRGAAAGLAAGKGAGNGGRALFAGVQEQRQFDQENSDRDLTNAEQEYARTRQTRLDKANAQIVQMQLAEGALRMNREQRQALNDQVAWADSRNAYYESQHAQDLGTYSSDDIHQIADKYPDVWKAHFNDNSIKAVPQYTEDGKPAGVKFYLTHPSLDNQPVPPGTKLHRFVTSEDANKPGHLVEEEPPPGMSRAEYDTADTTQINKLNADVDRVQKLEDSQTQRQLREEQIKNAPFERRRNAAEADRAEAEAQKARSDASFANNFGGQTPANITAEQPVNGVRQNFLNSLPEGERELVRAIGEGRKADVSNYALSRPNSPGAKIAQAVTLAYPGYDFTRAPVYQKTRQGFSDGKEAQGINALNTAMAHMQVMYDNATWANSLPLLGAASRYAGKQSAIDLATSKAALVDEIGKAYKAGALTQDDKDTWSGIIQKSSPLEIKGNAVAFIKLLNGKLESYQNQWKNGSPPGAIAPIALMGPKAAEAYKHITGQDAPLYTQGAQVQTGTTAPPPQQQGGTQSFVDKGVVYNIPLDKVSEFRADHPNAR